jgi:hypothetical protein
MELAASVPAFAGAISGTVPVFGLELGQPASANGEFVYHDPWLTTRGDRGDRAGRDSPKGGRNV